MNNHRGYFAIGIYHPKSGVNIGTLWRSAYIYGASFMFTIGRRYKPQASDTQKSWRHVPLFHYNGISDFSCSLPKDSRLVIIEINNGSRSLSSYTHPQRAIYILGAEDYGIPVDKFAQKDIVEIPSSKDICLNVSVAGSIVMYDRFSKNE